MKSWRQVSTAALRSVPPGAPAAARARALKAAGKEYRSMKRMKRNPRARTHADVEKHEPLYGSGYGRLTPYEQGSEDAKYHRRARSSNRKYREGYNDRRNKKTPYLKGIADGRAGRRPKSTDSYYMQGYETGERQPAGERAKRRKPRRNPFGPLRGMRNWGAGDWLAVGAFGAIVYALSRAAR